MSLRAVSYTVVTLDLRSGRVTQAAITPDEILADCGPKAGTRILAALAARGWADDSVPGDVVVRYVASPSEPPDPV